MDQDWDRVVEELGPKLFRYFRTRFSHEQSSDLTQETLIRLVQKNRDGRFNPSRGNQRMLAYGIAHFVGLEAQRSGHAVAPANELHTAPHFDETLIECEKFEQMRRALEKLEPIQSQILLLMIDEEMTLADIGVLLDMPTGTVKSHVHRAKEKLRQILSAKESI